MSIDEAVPRIHVDHAGNGHQPSSGLDSTSQEFTTTKAEDRSAIPGDLVTRLLCAAGYLREPFADLVNRDLIRPSQLALSPLWQVDAVRLARHAQRARRERRSRDLQLSAACGCLLIAGTLVLVALMSDQIGLGRALETWAVLWVWVYALGFLAVFAQYAWARREALAVAFDPDPVDATSEPLKPSVEQALRQLNATNVVLFEAESWPFVGSGVPLDHLMYPVDVSKGDLDRDGTRRKPISFTGAELQESLRRSLPKGISPEPTSANRLHVRGGSTAPVVELFAVGPVVADLAQAVRFRRPVAQVPDRVIEKYLHEPSETARVYTCFQHSAWGGQVVITLFFRAVVSNQTLFIETSVCALRPLQRLFYEVRSLSVRPSAAFLSVAVAALADTLPLLISSPRRLWRRSRRVRAQLLLARNVEREVQGKRDVDFGAVRSLRELAASDEISDHFVAMDEQMFQDFFNLRAFQCIRDFLHSKHIDLTEFDRRQTYLINRTTIHTGSVNGSVVNQGMSTTNLNLPRQGGSPSTEATSGDAGD